jgi:hypothetical protein
MDLAALLPHVAAFVLLGWRVGPAGLEIEAASRVMEGRCPLSNVSGQLDVRAESRHPHHHGCPSREPARPACRAGPALPVPQSCLLPQDVC